jgi:hypothetical protein
MPIYHDDFTIRDVEVYATALEDIRYAFDMARSGKSYDPMTIEQITTSEGTRYIAHSYAFDLWDGGRHHEAESLERIRKGMLDEVVRNLKEHIDLG